MKRRGGMKQWLLAPALALLALNAAAQIQAGREYQRIDPPRPGTADTRIEVIEFFYYGCPVCYETEPFLSRWLRTAPDYVAMRRAAWFALIDGVIWGPQTHQRSLLAVSAGRLR